MIKKYVVQRITPLYHLQMMVHIILIILFTGGSLPAGADLTKADPAETERFTIETAVDNLNKPWGMDFLPNGRVIITEKGGNLWVADLRSGKKTKILMDKPDIAVKGQGGLLDVAIDPQFSDKKPWVYLSYSAEGKGADGDGLYGTEVGRGKLQDNKLVEFETLFVAQPKKTSSYHFGSRLVFDQDHHLYITLGDRGDRHEAQNTSNHLGGVIRLYRDGGVPKDNPFVANKKVPDEIFSYGHRNIQGAFFDVKTKRLWMTEHGPQGGDELNIVKPGLNYGWPKITYGKEYGSGRDIGDGVKGLGVEPPLWEWTPSIAPSGLTVYHGDMFPEWEGDILAGALKYQLLSRLRFDSGKVVEKERLFEGDFGRIRDVAVDKHGAIYMLTDDRKGQLLKVKSASKVKQEGKIN